MKICIIGLGSIGKRHTENIVQVLNARKIEYQIEALRSSNSDLPERFNRIISRQYYNVEELPDDYDAIFVTNPTVFHYETIKKTINKTKHMFIEKPIFDSLDYKLSALPLKDNSVYYVACPLRHKSIFKYVKNKIIPNERIILARVISTSYLPLWRNGLDYRYIYSAKRDMGGGVTRDLIHEWDYVLDLFGNPEKVYHVQNHVSDLEIDSDDISVYIAKYSDMILEMHLDYIGHKAERILQLYTNNKRIDIDLITNEICWYSNYNLVGQEKFQNEDFYINELEYFFDCLDKRASNINTIENALNTLKVAIAEE